MRVGPDRRERYVQKRPYPRECALLRTSGGRPFGRCARAFGSTASTIDPAWRWSVWAGSNRTGLYRRHCRHAT